MPHVPADAAPQSKRFRTFEDGRRIYCCPGEVGNALNRAMPTQGTIVFAQGSSVLPGDGYSGPDTPFSFFQELKMHGETLFYPDEIHAPIPDTELSAGCTMENPKLFVDLCMGRDEGLSAVLLTNSSAAKKPQSLANPEALQNGSALPNREIVNCENLTSNQISESAYRLLYPATRKLVQKGNNCQASEERSPAGWDPLCRSRIAASGICPQAILQTSDSFHQKANLPVPSAALESTGIGGYTKQNSITNDVNGVFSNEQLFCKQVSSAMDFSRHDCSEVANWLMDHPSGYAAQMARCDPWTEQIRNNPHSPGTCQIRNWKETPSERLVSSWKFTQSFPVPLYQSGAQPVQQVSLYTNGELHSQYGTPAILHTSASVDPKTENLRKHRESKREALFDLNKVPNKGMKAKPKKHRPRVAREKPPRPAPSSKKSNGKTSNLKAKSQNLENAGFYVSCMNPLKDYLDQCGLNSQSPRNSFFSCDALLNTVNEQARSMPCNTVLTQPQTAETKQISSTDGILDMGTNLLLLKENLPLNISLRCKSNLQAAASRGQELPNNVNLPPANSTVKSVRRKRREDGENQRKSSQSKRKVQGASKFSLDVLGANQASAYHKSGLAFNMRISHSQDGPLNDHRMARDCVAQADESNSNIIRTGVKRKVMDNVPVNVSYQEPNTPIDLNSRIHAINTSSPFPPIAGSLQIPKVKNHQKKKGQKDLSSSSRSFTNMNLTQNPHEIEVWRHFQSYQSGSKTFISELPLTHLSSSGTSNNVIENLTACFQLLQLDEAKPCLEIVQYSDPGTDMVPYEGPFNPLRRKKLRPKVMLDMESNRMWKLLMGKEITNKHDAESQKETDGKWVEQRTGMKKKVDLFISKMHTVQGDRRFSQWKGSVVDSVVGAFLTQNVSDHLSSSAFMAVAAKFPINKEDSAVNDAEVSTYQDYAQHGATSYHLSDRDLSGECGSQETSVIAVDCLNMIPHGKSECSPCSPPIYEIEGWHSSTKEVDYRRTPESSESIVREFSPNDKPCNAKGQINPTALQSVQNCRSVSYSCNKEKNNSLHREREDFSSTPLESSIKSNSYNCRTDITSGRVRRRLFKELRSSWPAVEDNASCITGSSPQLESLERSVPEREVCTQQVKHMSDSCIHFSEMNCSGFNIEMTNKEGIFQDTHNIGSITSVSGHFENQLPEEKRFNSDQSGYLGSCESFSCPNQEYVHDSICGSVEAENSYLEQSACDVTLMKENESSTTPDNLSLAIQEGPCSQGLATSEEQNASSYSHLQATSCKTLATNENGAAIEVVEQLPSAKLSGIERAKLEESQGGSKKIFDWESLRRRCESHCGDSSEESTNIDASVQDAVDWEAVRLADVKDVADVIKERGMNNILAGRIKAFLERLQTDHGKIDLEWLRKVPVEDAKNFLLSVRGLGLKSVECIRLLTLQHLAFPVDTNVGRICVRLGWVPIEPLPEELQIHLLDLYPVQATIQKYLWPRLCTLDQRTLYELHYQMITFGKVFCTKSRPNCNACPMKGDCKHFSSAVASAKLALPAPEQKESKEESARFALPAAEQKDWKGCARLSLLAPEDRVIRETMPILALPAPDDERSPENQSNTLSVQILHALQNFRKICEPIIEEPASPEPYCMENWSTSTEQPATPSSDINYIVSSEESAIELARYIREDNLHLQQVGTSTSKALILMSPDRATIPVPKLKNVGRLRTVHYVYELPDNHELLAQMDAREADDPCFYLLAIWSPGESLESPPGLDHYPEVNSCTVGCHSAAASDETVKGTLLVFADHESSLNPIEVPRSLLWKLQRKFVYFGTSIPSIFRGLTTEEIKACFWKGYVCVRGFERRQRAPRPLAARLHFPASKRVVTRKKVPSDGKDESH
ncbi:hypothetical protein O6H91_20G065900 [Diphasiastrum complanatum]|uniref:Uncharacterized protein n=2 Tax=Diphasiastrum complanatum TaxID=34168 RepID=A0ACC2ARE4_DIPCM|nr:hypothetical protein O6H91_20G065900 [Diphasiastrum complanatum]KAJ7520089.1 hypothetical protein O6H91_20G065900 [Diphasiastrum complanatum]